MADIFLFRNKKIVFLYCKDLSSIQNDSAKTLGEISEGSANSSVCLLHMFKNKTPGIYFHCMFILWYLSKWTNVKYVMKWDVEMMAQAVVTQLNTQEVVV